jgi:hypothetical protein
MQAFVCCLGERKKVPSMSGYLESLKRVRREDLTPGFFEKKIAQPPPSSYATPPDTYSEETLRREKKEGGNYNCVS